MDIDKIWQEAPEGAEWLFDGDIFYKEVDGVFYGISAGMEAWKVTSVGRAFLDQYCTKRPADATTWQEGELPPVNTVVWYKKAKCKVFIVAHHFNGKCCIFTDEGFEEGLPYYGYVGDFAPLKTPEQIEAEERERAIEEMMVYTVPRLHDTSYSLAAKLYDAGYRKP